MIIFRNWFIFLLSLILFDAYSQIQITFPVTRIVFQRNNQNQANITIAGSYFQQLDRVDMRAVPVWNGQGSETGWSTAQDFHNNGLFKGTMQLNGGWYNIEVIGILNGNIVTSTTLERVGVGEVFIVAGQSNAQGDGVYSGATNGASDDRVSTINFYDPLLNEDNLPFQFSQMSNNTKMAPYNYVPWFWAKLGDRLTQRLNVPVLFYGAALGGISSEVWRRSAEGQDLRGELPLFIKVQGMPYRGMKAALQQYVTRTGLRGILWQQGESDSDFSSETYYNNLKTVIEKTRSDTKKDDLAWVVARSSRNPSVYPNVIQGQNFTIQRVPNVFVGPTTDEIQGSNFRADGIHFHNAGLTLAADYWSNALNDSFFSNARPLEAKPLPNINLQCNPNNTFNKFTIITEGYPFYKWNMGATTNFISANSGTFSFKAIDDVGNTFFSQPITILPNNNVVTPTVSYNGPTTFCDGQTLTLNSSVNGGNLWSNGERSQSIVIRNSGNYNLINYSINGCASVASSFVNVDVKSLPINYITTSKALPICPDDNIELIANSSDVTSYNWSTNESSTRITVNKPGNYNLKIQGNNGCFSESSINVNFRERPVTSIIADGATEFCFGKSVNISSRSDFNGYIWNNGSTSKSIRITTSGDYALIVNDNFGCKSEPILQKVVVNVNPVVKIKVEGLDSFCEGNIVKLSPDSQIGTIFKWNTGESTREINVANQGIYKLSVKDENNCESSPDSVRLTYIPSPLASISTIDNLNTICDGNMLTLTSGNAVSYLWNNNANSKEIVVDKAGTYSLKIRDDKNCESKPVSFDVFVKNTPLKPSINIAGAFQLEAIPSSKIDEQFFNWKKDEQLLSELSSILKANSSANYSVRTAIKYSLQGSKELFCYSPYSNPLDFFIPYRDKGLRVYPNPNPTGIFTIETLNDNPNAVVTVFNLLGQQLFATVISDLKEKRKLDLSTLGEGEFIIRLTSGTFSETSTIIIRY